MSAALERKVWVSNGKVTYYPNTFIFLVTFAGIGKSTAIFRGTDLLERIKGEMNPELNLIDEQVTEAAFVKKMSINQMMTIGSTMLPHSSGYFYASEASASALQNTHGNFVSTVTGFYDCPRVFRKTTITGGSIEFRNVAFSMLAGATFDYLKTLVNETSVMGGFASRIMYVVNKERLIREPKWGETEAEDTKTQEALLTDLAQVHKLIGRFEASREFISAWEAFQPESDRLLASLNSPRLESLAARRSNHVMKVAMILSVSESNSLRLEARHWDRALELVDGIMADNAFILAQGAMADKNSQLGVTQMLAQVVKKNGGRMQKTALKRAALSSAYPVDLVTKTFEFMLGSEWFRINDISGEVELLVDPDRYF